MAPIVVVKKEICICVDFKITANPHLLPKTFPLPTPDEILATLSGGECFTKLDLARAYKQIAASQSQLTINIHLGHFLYHQLPFGIAIAPAMYKT